jgi:hypothetical protein
LPCHISALRKMNTIVEKIVPYLPYGWVRDALLLALEGRDLIEEKNRQRGRTRNIGYELR